MTFVRCNKCNEMFPPEKVKKYSQTCLKCTDKNFSLLWVIAGACFILAVYYSGIMLPLIAFTPIFLLLHKRYPLKSTASSSIPPKNITPSPYEWARSVLIGRINNCVILDCETTGLGDQDEIIQLAIIDMRGNILFNSLIKPSPRKRISEKAQKNTRYYPRYFKKCAKFSGCCKRNF